MKARATTDDFIDYVRRTVRKRRNLMIIHTGTNDIQNNVNTLQKIRKVNSSIQEHDTDDTSKKHCLVLFIKVIMILRIKLMRLIGS